MLTGKTAAVVNKIELVCTALVFVFEKNTFIIIMQIIHQFTCYYPCTHVYRLYDKKINHKLNYYQTNTNQNQQKTKKKIETNYKTMNKL